MSKTPSKFPDCLENPDKAGIVRQRTEETEAFYRQRYEGIARTLARQMRVPQVEIDEVVQSLVGRATYLRKRSYYLYRAAIFQKMRDGYAAGSLTDKDVAALVQLLNSVDTRTIGSRVTAKRTSHNRRRHIRPEVNGALVTVLAASTHPTARNLADIIDYGTQIGVRPCEFLGAELEGTTLWISAAKFSPANERGLAARRPIELRDKFDVADLATLAGLFARLDAELKAVGGDRTRIVRRYAAALRRVRSQVPSADRVTLYTSRHQYRSNLARAGYAPPEIAALMGHASAQTNASHYGRANHGWKPVWGSRPVDVPAALVARVRPGARAKAKLAAERRVSLANAGSPKSKFRRSSV